MAYRHDRRNAYVYPGSGSPTAREAFGENWQPEAPRQPSLSSGHALQSPDDAEPADLTDGRRVNRRTAPPPERPYSAGRHIRPPLPPARDRRGGSQGEVVGDE